MMQYHTGDFNGDGRVDIAYIQYFTSGNAIKVCSGDTENPPVAIANGPTTNSTQAGNLLVKISNGTGGSTTIAYKPSTEYINTKLPFSVQTVSSIETNDGNGNVAETKYSYEGGYYLAAERDFRGFNHVTVTGPAGPNLEQKISETWFYQGTGSYVCYCSPCPPGVSCKPCGCGLYPPPADSTTPELKGKAYHTRVKDVSGAIYSETTVTYRGNIGATGFFYSPETTAEFTCDGSTTANCNGQSKMTKYGYDSYGNVTLEQVFTPADATTPYLTTARDFTTESTDKYIIGLPKYETISDASGQTISSTTYYYDDPSDCETRATPAGYTNQVPTQGNVTTIVRWFKEKTAGQTDPEINMSYEYGNLVCTRDGNGHASRTKYDLATSTYPTEKTNAKGHTAKTEYYGVNSSLTTGVYGQVARIIDPNPNASTIFEYDALGRKINSIDPYGAVQNYAYPGINDYGSAETRYTRITSTVNYSSGATTWKEIYFDGFGRTVKTRTQWPENNKVIRLDTIYDKRGAVLSSSLPYFEGASASVRTFKYDTMGRVLQRTDPGVTGTSDPNKKLTTTTCYQDGVTVQIDPDGNKKRQTKDVFGRLVQVDEYDLGSPFTSCTTVPESPYATTTYVYDEMGNLRFVNDAEGNQTEMRYDSLSRKYYMKDLDMGVWGYSYDTNNNLVSQTDANLRTIIFHYDELNRVTLKEYPKNLSLVMTDVNYTYDVAPDGSAVTYPIGRLSRMTDASGTTNYYYDMLGRTTQTSKAVDNVLPAYTIKTSYDPLGRPASITYPDTETVNYVYNADVLSAITGAVNYATYTNYNALGQPGIVTYGNGISTNYTYDSLNYRLKSILTGNADQTLINLTYGYYDGGNIASIVDGVDSTLTQWFWYDGLNRIQHAQTPNAASYGGVSDLFYNYSQTGNISYKEGISYNYTDSTGLRPHAVKSANGMSYSYDLNGNLISESDGSNVYRSITYDYDNMPASITVNNKSVGFVYDGSGSRAKRTFSSGENIYLGKLYECREGVCTKYIFAGDTRLAMKTGADVLYYHQDHLGSTQVITQTGAIQADLCSSQPVLIAGATPRFFSTLQDAYDHASNGDIIQARAVNFGSVELPVVLNLSSGITVTIQGGYNCDFTSQVENSELVGSITVNTGQVTIENFEIVTVSYSKYRAEEVRYLPFGEMLRDVGEITVTHKYTSQEFDAETGLYNYGARFYNPALGRFISPDTIVPDYTNPQSLNRFSYVLNNPLGMVDPTGHAEEQYGYCSNESSGSNWGNWNFSNLFGQVNLEGIQNSAADFAAGYLAYVANDFKETATKIWSFPEEHPTQFVLLAIGAPEMAGLPEGANTMYGYLRGIGFDHAASTEVISTFVPETIQVRNAGFADFGIRFSGGGSGPVGRYLSPTFPNGSARALSALPPENSLEVISQLQVRQSSIFFSGNVAPNFGQPGGGTQWYVPHIEDLILQ